MPSKTLSLPLAAGLSLILTLSATAQKSPAPAYDPTPRIGVLIPKGPPDYALWYDNLHDKHDVTDGPFIYNTGTIGGLPVVLIVQPADGVVVRGFETITMIHNFNLRAILYPGTSGAHLPKGEMSIGDVVLGAENVDYGNHYLSPTGAIEPGEFKALQPTMQHYGPLYSDPQLLAMLACSATRVVAKSDLPPFVEPVRKDAHPQIFYYGIQGTTTVWSDNQAYSDSIRKVFHEIDEDGDWYSDLAATMYKVPFIEVSVISDSIYAFPQHSHGTPAGPEGQPNSHIIAQRISNRISLDLLAHYGQSILAGHFTTPITDPFPTGVFDHPKDPQGLLAHCQ